MLVANIGVPGLSLTKIICSLLNGPECGEEQQKVGIMRIKNYYIVFLLKKYLHIYPQTNNQNGLPYQKQEFKPGLVNSGIELKDDSLAWQVHEIWKWKSLPAAAVPLNRADGEPTFLKSWLRRDRHGITTGRLHYIVQGYI